MFVYRRFASRVALVDRPGQLKTHRGEVPLVGGLAIFTGYVSGLMLSPSLPGHLAWLLLIAAVLLLAGVVDDRYRLGAATRLLVQIGVAAACVGLAGINVSNIGNPFNFGVIELGWLSGPFTCLVIVGAINAWNMVDGTDGLAAALALVGLLFLLLICGVGDAAIRASLLALTFATGAFLFFNMPLEKVRKRRTFLGDAGSTFLGLVIVSHALYLSQGETAAVSPVTALWFVAVPVFEVLCAPLRRIRAGNSPLAGDRQHLHHLLYDRLSLSPLQTLGVMLLLAVAAGVAGLAGNWLGIADSIMFSLFVATGIAYYAALQWLTAIGASARCGDETKAVVAIVANTAWYLYNFRLNLARSLQQAGHRVVMVGPADDDFDRRIRKAGIEFRAIPLVVNSVNPAREMLALVGLLRVLFRSQAGIILSYTPKGNLYAGLCAILLRKIFVPNISGLGYTFIRRSIFTSAILTLYRIVLRFAPQVFFQNNDDLELFARLGLVRREAAERLPGSGVDLVRFNAANTTAWSALRRRSVFLLPARMLWDKGIGEFVQAAGLVRAQNPGAQFRLLGAVVEKHPNAVSRRILEQWETEGIITYLGSADDVRPAMLAADCIVLPSYREGVPRSLLEAAALSRPVITTDVPGCRDAVVDGTTGWLCEARNSISLATRMLHFCELDRTQRRAFGRRGRKYIERVFDERFVIDRYLQVVARLTVAGSAGTMAAPAAMPETSGHATADSHAAGRRDAPSR